MNKTKEQIRVKKTDKLDQRKLTRIARKYGVSPLSVRELQLGFSEDIPEKAAELLIEEGYVTEVKTKPRSNNKRVKSLDNTKDTEPTLTSDNDSTKVVSPDRVENSDPVDNNEETV